MQSDDPALAGGNFTANLLVFVRLLRYSGVKISTYQAQSLAEALPAIDLSCRADVYHTMRAFLVLHRAHHELFDRAFELFWLDRSSWQLELATRPGAASSIKPGGKDPGGDNATAGRKLALDLRQPDVDEDPDPADQPWISPTYSPAEILRQKDFSDYTEEDLALASQLLKNRRWLEAQRRSRRRIRKSSLADQLDFPRSVRKSLKQGGEFFDLAWLTRKSKPRPIVILCDVSGSMARYSRIFLHFMYTLVNETSRMETFVFGTRLTRVTRALRQRDVDDALAKTSELVFDWAGGTRIGQSLREFNFRWARRVLRHGAQVIIISDGWDRGEIQLLEAEISRLRRRASRLIWLNPLLGSPDYQPLVRGIQAVLPFVDDFLPLHNLLSLEALALKIQDPR